MRGCTDMCEDAKRQDQTGSNLGPLGLGKGQKVETETQGMAKNAKQVFSSGEPIHRDEDKAQAFKSSECKFRILVVDDSQNIREMLEDFLGFEGHQPVLAREGNEALKLFSEQDFDLVITDLGMPGMSGWQLSRHVKQRKPETPIIVITGWGAQLSEEDLKNNDVELVLSKPFHLDQVKQAIDAVAGKLSRQHEAPKRVD